MLLKYLYILEEERQSVTWFFIYCLKNKLVDLLKTVFRNQQDHTRSNDRVLKLLKYI